MNLQIRTDTHDPGIVYEVWNKNVYFVPEKLNSDDVIIDIGAHVGSFSLLCAFRGSDRILAFEAWNENYRLLVQNSLLFIGSITPIYGAIVRSNEKDFVDFSPCKEEKNTGGGNINLSKGNIPTFSLDSVLSRVARVRMLKLDCEASEFPILFSCNQLHKVDEITGEYHTGEVKFQYPDLPEPTLHNLTSYLDKKGFNVSVNKVNETIGYFRAIRRR